MPITANGLSWILESRHSAYTFGFNAAGLLAHAYWGVRLLDATDYPLPSQPSDWASFDLAPHLTMEEYPGSGGGRFSEPCLKVTFADGVRDLVLRFVSAEIEAGDHPHLRLVLTDEAYPLDVILHYRVHEAYDLIERWTEVHNHGTTPIDIQRIFSAQWHVPAGQTYRMTHLTGRWLDEMQIRREPLTHGVKVLESRRLTTSHHHSPWFALDTGHADEHSGAVWFGALAWSGNWKLAAEVTDLQATRVSIGLNDWDFAWTLKPNETFITPASISGYTTGGFHGASQAFHDYIREQVLPHGPMLHKVLYNSWEATFFDVDEASQGALAEIAAQMGVELFVMDDGWFQGRHSDKAGLGDWFPDAGKFPQGLTPLIERVNALGMEFGLWLEPEMVNRESDLYRAHPDWVIHFPTRPRTEARNQLILNFGREDVQAYIIALIDQLLTDNKIAFIKWDMNRNVSEAGWPDSDFDARELWVRYVKGLYHVWGTLRQRHPDVIWQSCSGGGGRADLGILQLADQIWVSDNTQAARRLAMQEGFSQMFPATTMEAWVTDAAQDHLSLQFRFHVSMCGALGVGANLLHWTPAQREEAAQYIATYKSIRPLVQLGNQYRLRSAHDGPFSAVQYVSKDQAESVVFAFRTYQAPPAVYPVLYLAGLDPQSRYRVEGMEGVYSGLALMHSGIRLTLDNFESTMRRIERV